MHFLDRLLSCPFGSRTGVWSRQCRLPWRFTTRSSWPWLMCPSLCSDRCSGPNSAELCLEAHSCSSWTRLLTCPLFSTTCARGGPDSSSWTRLLTCPLFSTTRACGGPDSAVLAVQCGVLGDSQVQFLDKLSMPVVVMSGADGQTVQKTVVTPQLQLFVVKVLKTVEAPQCSSSTWVVWFMDKVVDCPLLETTRGNSTGAVLGQGVHACCCCVLPMARQSRKLWRCHSFSF